MKEPGIFRFGMMDLVLLIMGISFFVLIFYMTLQSFTHLLNIQFWQIKILMCKEK